MGSKYEWVFNKLNGYLDMLYESGCLFEEEISNLNDDIIQIIRELEQKKESVEVKCNNTKCIYHRGGRCTASGITLNPQGVYLFQDNQYPPYEECANCIYDHFHCDGVLGREFCAEFEKEEEK